MRPRVRARGLRRAPRARSEPGRRRSPAPTPRGRARHRRGTPDGRRPRRHELRRSRTSSPRSLAYRSAPERMGAMSHIAVSRLAYAHPGGELLFSDVSFRVSAGQHVGLVGANGVGKSTLLRVLTGALPADDGDASVGGVIGYMAQDVGSSRESGTVRELLLSLGSPAVRSAGLRVIGHERELAAGDDSAGVPLGGAIGDWSAL